MNKSDGWQKVGVDEIIATFDSDKDNGLDEKRIKEVQRKWGMNSLWYYGSAFMFLKNESVFSIIGYIILAISAFTASAFGICNDAGIIGFTIVLGLIVLFSFEIFAGIICSGCCEKWIPYSTVIRNGKTIRIRGDRIVPGDIIVLKKGDTVTADMKLIISDSLTVREPVFFKSSAPVIKTAVGNMPVTEGQPKPDDCLYAGSEILSGFGKAVVVTVGYNTVLGKNGKIKLTPDTEPAHLAIARKNGVSLGTSFMILSFAAVSIGVFSPLTAVDFIGLFLIFLSFAVTAGGEIYPALCSLMYSLAASRAKEHGITVRDAIATDFIISCKGIAAENSSIMKSGEADLKMIYTFGKVCKPGEREADELFSLLYTGTGRCKGKYSREIIGAVNEHLSPDSNFERFESGVMSTKSLVDYVSSGRLQYSLFASGNSHYFTMLGSIDDIIGHCTKVRVNGRDVPINRSSLESILNAAGDATKSAMYLIAVAVRESPYITMNRLSVLTSDLTFAGFIAVDAPADSSIPNNLTYLRQENIPFFLFSDGSGEDVNFARRLGIINSREDIISAKNPDATISAVLSEHSKGGLIEIESEDNMISVLKAAGKSNHRIISVGHPESLKNCGFTAVIGETTIGSGILINSKDRAEVSSLLRALKSLKNLFSRFNTARKFLFVSTITRAVYCLTVLFGSSYVYPSAVLIWGIFFDVLVSLLILCVRQSSDKN